MKSKMENTSNDWICCDVSDDGTSDRLSEPDTLSAEAGAVSKFDIQAAQLYRFAALCARLR